MAEESQVEEALADRLRSGQQDLLEKARDGDGSAAHRPFNDEGDEPQDNPDEPHRCCKQPLRRSVSPTGLKRGSAPVLSHGPTPFSPTGELLLGPPPPAPRRHISMEAESWSFAMLRSCMT